MKDKAKKLIDKSLEALHELNDYATRGDQWLAILNAETAVHEILVTFEQEIDEGD